MKNFSKKAVLAICVLGLSLQAQAGNKDRSGQAGATELLVNPWAQSTGLFAMNGSYVTGVEAMKCNIAGLAFVEKTDFGLSHTEYLSGSNVNVNNLALAQRVGGSGVLGVNVMSMGFGEIPVRTVANPDGNLGTYSPTFYNIQLGYAKSFSNSIHVGIAATLVNEQLTNIHAMGAAFDAGVQYVTGKHDNFHFGITLRNIGTNMRFSGSGFSINAEAPDNPNNQQNRLTPTEKFELPTYLNLGVSYDFILDDNHVKNDTTKPNHKLTVLANFTSNSFNNDYLGAGLEYTFHNLFSLRAAYRYEQNIGDAALSTTMFQGFSAGATVQHTIGSTGPMIAFDYSYRPTVRPANGVHAFGIRVMRR